MTLNQFIASIRAFAENHYQINRFGTGPFSYIEKDLGSSASYPYLWVVVESVQVRQATLLLRTRFTVLDSMREDDSNLQDVWSDTQQIVLDCFNYLKRQTEELDVEGFPTIIPIQEKLTEYVGGMGMTIDVVVDYDSSCNMPLSEMPEFVDVAGPDFITCEDLQYCETIVDLTSRLVAAESTLINIGLSTDELLSRMSDMETLVPGGYTQGSVLIADASGNVSQDHSGLYFNSSTNSLGIGSSNPLWNLYVNGTARITSTLMVGSKVTDNNTWNNLEFVDGNTIAMNVHNVSITRWLASGSFLIGTTSDLARLSVVSGGSTNATKALAIQNSSAASLLTVYDDGTKYFSQGSNIFFSPTLFRTFTEHQNGNSAYFYNSGNTTYYRLNNQGDVYTLQHLSGGNIWTMSNTGQMNGSDLWRVTNQLSTPTSGSGIELYYQPGATLGKIQAYDRSTSAYRTLGLDGSTIWLNANSGGSVAIGTTSATARFQVRGSGSTSATSTVLLQNSSGIELYKLDDSGGVTGKNSSGQQIYTIGINGFLNLGQWNGYVGVGSFDGSNNSASGLALRLNANTSTQALYSYYFKATNQRQPTSGVAGHIYSTVNFNPTSGTAAFNNFEISGDINQTGGASGITRGLYVNVGVTSAVDFRAIETTNSLGYSFYSGSAPSHFGGDIQQKSSGGRLILWNTAASANGGRYQWTTDATNIYWQTRSDDNTAGDIIMQAERGGTTHILSKVTLHTVLSINSSDNVLIRTNAHSYTASARLEVYGSGTTYASDTVSFKDSAGTFTYQGRDDGSHRWNSAVSGESSSDFVFRRRNSGGLGNLAEFISTNDNLIRVSTTSTGGNTFFIFKNIGDGVDTWSMGRSHTGVFNLSHYSGSEIGSGTTTSVMTATSSKVTFATDVEVGSTGSYYIGDKDTDGSWRFTRSGSDLVVERRIAGTYVTKQTIIG